MSDKHYDAVIVGAGIAGAIVARQLAEKGKSVLVLEAGTGAGLNADAYRDFVTYFHGQVAKVPNSPYPANANAPAPSVLDNERIKPGEQLDKGYWVQKGPMPFASNYTRVVGGTTMHFLGTFLRMMPNDFKIKSNYGHGRDWPMSYEDLQPHYRSAEREGGVSAEVEDQQYGEAAGFDTPQVPFDDRYSYPMHRIPQSWFDQWLARQTADMSFAPDGKEELPVRVVSTPQARNGMPNHEYRDIDADDATESPEYPRSGFEPVGMVGDPERGKRCEGNASCIPICPVQAKYNALKTLDAAIKTGKVDFQAQSVVTHVEVGEDGRVREVVYKQYAEPDSPVHTTGVARGTIVVLAAHAVENAKILLANNVANSSDQVGRNLMDHPYFLTWGMAPEPVGSYRGPGATSGIPTLRDGAFRSSQAAWRVEVGNWGWTLSDEAPFKQIRDWADDGLFGSKLRQRIRHDFPRHIRLGFLLEQLADPGNRVTVDDRYRDQMGVHRPVIEYDIDDYTVQGVVSAKNFWLELCRKAGIDDHTFKEKPGDTQNILTLPDGDEVPIYGSGHLVGTHIMGDSAGDSVVDSHQRSWDHDNLYLVGCGSMPTVGTSNPTLTLAALAFRASEKILSDLGSGSYEVAGSAGGSQ